MDALCLQRNLLNCSQWSVKSNSSSVPLLALLSSPLWVNLVQGYLFDMNQSTFISPAFWKPFMFFLFILPSFHPLVSQIHTALSACCCCCFCRWHFTARQQIAFCWVLLHHTSTSKRTHATTTCTYSRTSDIIPLLFFLSCVWHCFLFVILFLHFMFCWQLNGTGRFHGLASLDDITAIISTPPLGGFQVATPTSPKSVVENDQLKAIEQDEP